MLIRKFPMPVKFICGFIYSDNNVYLETKYCLQKKFKAIDYESEQIIFHYTTYYNKEMSGFLLRRFVSFERLVMPEQLIALKLFCMKLEAKFSEDARRKINIDPGYLNAAKLVLATTKDYSHRIYLGKGIFAEVTLFYANNNFQDLSSTYFDYRTEDYKKNFRVMRDLYQKKINR